MNGTEYSVLLKPDGLGSYPNSKSEDDAGMGGRGTRGTEAELD